MQDKEKRKDLFVGAKQSLSNPIWGFSPPTLDNNL